MKNETLLQKVRESKVQGPFKIDMKESGFWHLLPLRLKRWKPETLLPDEPLQSVQDVANYLEKYYLGKSTTPGELIYNWEIVNERIKSGSRVLKLRDILHPDSIAARHNDSNDYVWLRVKPSF